MLWLGKSKTPGFGSNMSHESLSITSATSMWTTVRRFGLEYCDLPTLVWNVSVMLRVTAVKIERGSHSIPKFFYILTVVGIIAYILNYHVSAYCFVFVDCQRTGDVLAAIMVLTMATNSLISLTKLTYIFMYQSKVQTMVEGYLSYDRLPLAPATAGILATTMRHVKMRAVLFWIVVMGNAFMYNLQPLVMPRDYILYDKQLQFGLELILGTTNYPFVVGTLFISTAFVCFVVGNITGLLIITAGYSEGRILALSQEIRDIWSDANKNYRDNFDETFLENSHNPKAREELNKYVKQRLHYIVESHSMNIGLIKKIEFIFRDAIAVEFILLTISLIAELLGGLENTYILAPFTLIQVCMDCYVGQKLMDAGLIFERAVYDSKWENFDFSNMKTVLLVLKMSQKELTLSAGGVATLSFRCLMALYKSVYSAYTALRSTME